VSAKRYAQVNRAWIERHDVEAIAERSREDLDVVLDDLVPGAGWAAGVDDQRADALLRIRRGQADDRQSNPATAGVGVVLRDLDRRALVATTTVIPRDWGHGRAGRGGWARR